MNTVKHFKDLGLEFVVGDECRDEGEHPFAGKWVDHVNRGDGNWDLDEVKKFAWRENTGKAPEFKGEIEVELQSGEAMTGNAHHFVWRTAKGVVIQGNIIQWRPLLTQQKPQPEKPIYTQEMADAGELPPVGATVLIEHVGGKRYGEYKAEYVSDQYIISSNFESVEQHYHIGSVKILPLKTQRDIEIELIGEMVGEMLDGATNENDFERLYDMGYRVTKVEE